MASSLAPVNKGILGKKLGMTQIFKQDGTRIPVTVVSAGPCVVTQKKSAEKDGYAAIQLGIGDVKEKHMNKPTKGKFEKAGVAPKRHLREIKFCEEVYSALNVGDEVKADQFSEGDFVDVVGVTIGKGFQGVMKKYNFSGKPASHGCHESFRGAGSIGNRKTPGRVFKGKKMPGQMGNANFTAQNLKVAKVDAEKNLIYIKGAVPGNKDCLIMVRDSVKKPSEAAIGNAKA
jgi:large subunit ribosomal protein L3